MDYERLAKIEALLEGLDKKVDGLCEAHGETRRTLYGNNGAPGLIVRLDRLEQAQERSKWLTRAVVGAVVTLLVGGAWSVLSG